MDPFTLIVIGGLVLVALVLFGLGLFHPARATEITDSDRYERWASQADIEEREVGEMVEGQNVYRRARGVPKLTEEDARREGAERQRESLGRARGSLR
jgi:FtsZ-interacting cell division protein ZipA